MMYQDTAKVVKRHTAKAESNDKTTFGFWVYLMTDCVLFATLFAVYAVLHNNTADGPSSDGLFSLPLVLTETIILLTSSFVCGLAILAARQGRKKAVMSFLIITGLLGLAFLGIELTEFRDLIHEGHSWRQSAFLSSFFTLVGTHGLHIASGLIWLVTLLWQISKQGLSGSSLKRLTLFGMFWHFLDVVWIFIFTIVYMIGSL
ncbi:MAG: putative cytochrome o ubiquinol oxidase chain cyoC [Candidatus Saccharibacteria bacterium]|nr:putative cytochrome o ubiquinol oxidase chain cyoC [Candidatus Saccharibacteria bacterium]